MYAIGIGLAFLGIEMVNEEQITVVVAVELFYLATKKASCLF